LCIVVFLGGEINRLRYLIVSDIETVFVFIEDAGHAKLLVGYYSPLKNAGLRVPKMLKSGKCAVFSKWSFFYLYNYMIGLFCKITLIDVVF